MTRGPWILASLAMAVAVAALALSVVALVGDAAGGASSLNRLTGRAGTPSAPRNVPERLHTGDAQLSGSCRQ